MNRLYFRTFFFFLNMILIVVISYTFVQSQETDSQGRTISSPKAGLLPISLPQLERLDEAVANQIRSFQQSVIDLIARGDTTDAELVDGYGMLGQLYHAYEIFEPAESCYLNASQLAPEEHSWFHLLATLYKQIGQLEKSVHYYKAVREMKSDYIAAASLLGGVYIQLNQLEDAREEFQAALKINPDFPSAINGLGQVCLAEKKYAEAVKYFQDTLEKIPGANRIHYSLAMAYRGLGDLDKAKLHLSKQGTVGVRPVDPLIDMLDGLIQGERVHLIQGRMAFGAGRYRDAAELFEKAVKAKPQSERARVNLGVSLAKTGDVDGAIEQFRAALIYAPENLNAHFNLGVELYKKNEFSEAIKHFESVLKDSPDDLETQRELAKSLIKIGREDKALDYLKKANEQIPDDEPVLLLLSKVLIQFEHYKETFDLLEQAHQKYPERGLTTHDLARFLAACPDTSFRDGERAVDLANRVFQVQKIPLHAETLSLALAEAGRCEEAATLQKRLISIVEQNNKNVPLERYKLDLERYEKGNPCRPPGRDWN